MAERPADDPWRTTSDCARLALIAGAVGMPAVERDRPATVRTVSTLLVAHLAVKAIKLLVPEERPDCSDDRSFPSCHAIEGFAAATVLARRYGPRLGWIALAAASLAGVARVKAKRHHWRDVLTGGLAGAGLAWGLDRLPISAAIGATRGTGG